MIRLVVVLLVLAGPAWAISDPSEALADPRQEARAVEIGQQLRCLVCQNESIEESGAELARDLRKIVRTQVSAGKSDAEIIGWLVARYGDFVRLRPPFTLGTALLWGSPVIALLAGLLAALGLRRRKPATVAPLSAAERQRLESLLKP
jgi:cytochrome c-type biogenesis protein CcmH